MYFIFFTYKFYRRYVRRPVGAAQGLFQPMIARLLDNNSYAAKSKQTSKSIILGFISVKIRIFFAPLGININSFKSINCSAFY